MGHLQHGQLLLHVRKNLIHAEQQENVNKQVVAPVHHLVHGQTHHHVQKHLVAETAVVIRQQNVKPLTHVTVLHGLNGKMLLRVHRQPTKTVVAMKQSVNNQQEQGNCNKEQEHVNH